jgi:hypothetical protein
VAIQSAVRVNIFLELSEREATLLIDRGDAIPVIIVKAVDEPRVEPAEFAFAL